MQYITQCMTPLHHLFFPLYSRWITHIIFTFLNAPPVHTRTLVKRFVIFWTIPVAETLYALL